MRLRGFLAMAVCVVGCASSASDDAVPVLLGDAPVEVSSRGGVAMEVSAVDPIKLGKNRLAVFFPTAEGATLESVSALMPAHGHGSPAPIVEPTDRGYSVRDVVLYMSGRWELHFSLKVDGGADDEAVVAVDVP